MRYRFFLLPTLFCWAFAAMAATPKAKVDVHVTTAAGDPIEHAEVAVKVVKGEKATTIWRVHTNEDGIAKPPAEAEIRQGKILVEVMADEYETFSQTFDVNEPHQSIDVKLRTALVRIDVHVTTMGGRPIERADVVVKFVKGRSVVELGRKLHTSWEMRTNQEGVAKVPGIPRGSILIQVIAKGYQTFGETFEVDGLERTIEVKLNSPQEQYTAH